MCPSHHDIDTDLDQRLRFLCQGVGICERKGRVGYVGTSLGFFIKVDRASRGADKSMSITSVKKRYNLLASTGKIIAIRKLEGTL